MIGNPPATPTPPPSVAALYERILFLEVQIHAMMEEMAALTGQESRTSVIQKDIDEGHSFRRNQATSNGEAPLQDSTFFENHSGKLFDPTTVLSSCYTFHASRTI
ncbi:hypothetical protein BCR33DRAFT_713250 [Rhizoclosmatium globosum]|uniref:Uncharacterized protein n=1 Tax=Rhizoclosmatium globosum TaxID=329046 RepID=A0A1Y2CTV1_9FUNG|nr:hypothetical protein BCR33DRAFT_713250 [Rhizoclosmatium globosum]|eukprot:ORY50453.1 hypothetical protein BCR33DRAFT_713250 [Rhizoclosmatium globosum]